MDIAFLKESQQIAHVLLAKAVVKMLEDIEMQYAFGILGGAIAFLWHSSSTSCNTVQFSYFTGDFLELSLNNA
ncbi:hypothetical protein [Nostoc sp.]|uniref:hypothetical protein n=1 Tax=Nostoc sp. TaxID=1180 RepID=UPI002FF8AC26